MKKRLLFVCPVLLFAASAWGSTCGNGPLSNYLGSGFSCTSANGDFLFSGFSYSPDTFTGQPPAKDVGVTFVDDGTNEGFSFTGDWSSSAGGSSDALLSYSVVTAGADAGQNLITGNTVALNSSSATPIGDAKIVEGICTSAPSKTGACTPAYTLEVDNNSGNPPAIPASEVQHDSIMFPAAVSSDYMTKNIMLTGEAGISEFTNTVQVSGGGGAGTGGSPVPEPGSTVLIGSGLIAASLVLRKKIRRTV